eukprot:9496507-Pyramimonas_sp.AAC.2
MALTGSQGPSPGRRWVLRQAMAGFFARLWMGSSPDCSLSPPGQTSEYRSTHSCHADANPHLARSPFSIKLVASREARGPTDWGELRVRRLWQGARDARGHEHRRGPQQYEARPRHSTRDRG